MNMLMIFIFLILVLQCVLMLWAFLPACSNQVMLGMEHCLEEVRNVLMVPIFVILVPQCVLILRAFPCSCKSGYTKNGTLCTDMDEWANGTHSCHSGRAMCANLVGLFTC